MANQLTEEQFLERFPEIAQGYLNFALEEGFTPEDYQFRGAYALDDSTLNVVAWYPVDFDFSIVDGSQRYSWVNYEAGDGFNFIDE